MASTSFVPLEGHSLDDLCNDGSMYVSQSSIELENPPLTAQPSLLAACKLVQEILDQVAKDSPNNEAEELMIQSSATEIVGTSSFGSESSSVFQFFQDYLVPEKEDGSTGVHHVSATRMGQTALVSLCNWTLEQIQGASPVLKPTPVTPKLELDLLLPQTRTTTSTDYEVHRSKHGRFWRKGEEKKDDTSVSQPRLQMFASEYARYLSNSQLAPPPCRSKAARLNFRGKSKRTVNNASRALEDADPATLTGAILDICVADTPPMGYYRLTQTASGLPIPLKKTICIKKEPNWDKAAQRPTVTAIALIFPDRQEFVPPGFCVVKTPDKEPANLGQEERCFLVFRRSREGNPLTGILPLVPPESVPLGYTVLERSPRNHVANFGGQLFLAFRQRLANLEALRPLPLIRSVQPKAGADFLHDIEDDDDESAVPAKLQSYYATGGTTVSANVGRFHILDRSTHSLLSPSSVANRLHLIELSRRRATQDGGSISDDAESLSSRRDSLETTQIAEDIEADDEPILSSLYKPQQHSSSMMMMYSNEPSLPQALEAMSFIPIVETPNKSSDILLQARTVLLTPLLTACYTRHGGAALAATDGLTKLLDADFFADDVSQEIDNESSTRLTLLDLSIQVICDVATSSSMETSFPSCVEFVEKAVQYAQGQLNTRTVGYIVRFYLFVFYFGASVSKSWRWPKSYAGVEDEEDDLLFDPRKGTTLTYLPGGAPQSAALAFKELISLSIVRLGKVSVTDLMDMKTKNSDINERIESFLAGILSTLVNDAVDHVDRANYTQLAYYQIHRSGGSELFWHDMVNACGMGLFGKDKSLSDAGRDIYVMIFAVLASLVKVASGKMRPRTDQLSLQPRDLASKLLSFELLLHFLEFWSDEQEAVKEVAPAVDASDRRSVDTLAFAIRRTVVPSLLANTRCALEDPYVFRRMIRIITELWCSPIYRSHCKAELGVLFEHFALRILQMGPQIGIPYQLKASPEYANVPLLMHQVELIKEIKNWFCNDPKDVIEMYLNFDTDLCCEVTGPIQLLPGTQLKIFQRLCAGLSNIAEQCGEIIGDQIRESQSKIMSESHSVDSLTETNETMNKGSRIMVDKGAVREAAKLLRKTSLEATSQIVKSLAISAAAASGNEFMSLLLSWTPYDSPYAYDSTTSSRAEKGTPRKTSSGSIKPKIGGDDDVLAFWRAAIAADKQHRLLSAVPSSRESLQVALDIARRKSLKKAVEYLIACNSLSPSPRDVATFLQINKDNLDPAALGLYLSECGIGGLEAEYWKSIRHLYVRSISFVGMTVEEGLRHFLTNCGFRLPGEAQRIDRILCTFAHCYFEDNAGDSLRCPFKTEDSVYLLSFAIMMLNTDLHKARSRKGRKTMSKAEFINNLRGVENGNDISREYLSGVYDSIESDPIEVHNDAIEDGMDARSRSLQGMLNNVRNADSLLRGLAVHDFRFAKVDDFVHGLEYNAQDALGDLTRSSVAKTWHQWHGVINTGLETAHLDPAGMEPSVEILLYALSLTVCLDMPTERSAFLNQLGRLKAFEERRQGRWVSAPEYDSYREEDWYLELEQACAGSNDRKLWALRKIREWMVSLKSALQVDVKNKIRMAETVKQLVDGSFLLQDPARSFIRCGDLLKKSSRTGRSIEYRFYLFTDVILYAKRQEPDGRFKIHEELPLHLMKIIDWFPPSQKHRQVMFEIHHPRKSFFVICPSAEDRKVWIQEIKAAASLEMERKMKIEAARMAIYTR